MEETWDFKKEEKSNVMSKQTVLLMSFAKVVWQLKQKKKKKIIQYGAQHTKRQHFIDSYIKEWRITYPMEVSFYMSKC